MGRSDQIRSDINNPNVTFVTIEYKKDTCFQTLLLRIIQKGAKLTGIQMINNSNEEMFVELKVTRELNKNLKYELISMNRSIDQIPRSTKPT